MMAIANERIQAGGNTAEELDLANHAGVALNNAILGDLASEVGHDIIHRYQSPNQALRLSSGSDLPAKRRM
jgi:hypothetical protein